MMKLCEAQTWCQKLASMVLDLALQALQGTEIFYSRNL